MVSILRILLLVITLSLFHYKLFSQKIKVAIASSLIAPMQKIKSNFEKTCNCGVELIPGASGMLTNQISMGAPFDIFISANEKYTSLLSENNLVLGEPQIIAIGQLIVWSKYPIANWSVPSSIKRLNECLFQKDNKTVAITQAELAPYGEAALDVLRRCANHSGFKKNLIFGNSISLINQYIVTEATDIVLTSKSSQVILSKKVSKYWYDLP